jgi:MFS family permease
VIKIRSLGAIRVFQNRAYRIYTEGNFVSLIGTWVQRVATGWLAWDLTHSGAWLGAIAAAELLPSIILGPLGGAAADRTDRFKLILVAQVLMAIQAFALGITVLSGWIDIWSLFLLTVSQGIVVSFNQPARLSLVRDLVRTEDLPTAIAINSVLWNGARFVGPVCAGLLIVVFEIGWSFIANGLSFLVFVVAMLRLRREIPRREIAKGGAVLQQIVEGVVYAYRHPGMAPLLLLLLISAIFARPFAELLPGFADAIFGEGAHGLAMLTAATGTGAVVGGIWMSQVAKLGGLTALSLHSNMVLAAALLLLCATKLFWVGLIATAIAGMAMTIHGVATQSLIQFSCPQEMMGRILSLYGLSFRAGPALGALLMGTASEWLGLRIPVAVGAVICLIGWALIARRQRSIATAMGEGALSGPDQARTSP